MKRCPSITTGVLVIALMAFGFASSSYGTGAIVHIAAVSPMPKAGGKWNTYDITVKGTRLTVTLNGVRTADVEDSKLPSGPIALQYHAGVVKFRKVQIKPL